jgi:hypothetical protein
MNKKGKKSKLKPRGLKSIRSNTRTGFLEGLRERFSGRYFRVKNHPLEK